MTALGSVAPLARPQDMPYWARALGAASKDEAQINDLIDTWRTSFGAPSRDDDEHIEATKTLYRGMMGGVESSTLVWVTSDMSRVVEAAAASFPDTASAPAIRAIRSLVWMQQGISTPAISEVWAGRVRAIYSSVEGDLWFGQLWYDLDDDRCISSVPILLQIEADAEVSDRRLQLYRRVRPIYGALFALLEQRIAVRHTFMPDRAERRRCQRMGVTPPSIQIVDLRRPIAEESEPSEGSPVNWSSRWIVGGHWRSQYMPSTDTHQPRWIAPYVKGPEGKPLVVRDRVYRLSR